MSDEKVGYGKPPKKNQFKPGKSGNPSGRPKVHLPLHEIVLKEAHSPISLKLNGKQVKSTKIEVVTQQLLNKAMKGDNASMKLAFSTIAKSEIDEVEAAKDTSLLYARKPKKFDWTEEFENIHRMLEDNPISEEKDEDDNDDDTEN
jgi:Family of unknown function (DUF5681)